MEETHPAAGHGPVWNPSRPPAEGFTNFLWMLLMAIPHAWHLDPLNFARGVGIASLLGSFAVTFAFALRLCDSPDASTRRLSACVAVFILASFYPASAHAVSGMETSLFSLLVTAFLYLAVFVPERSTHLDMATVPLAGLLLGLTRPDGLVVAACGLFLVWLRCDRKQRLRLLSWSLALLVLPGSIYFLWRATYYGHLLPLPFYLKVGHRSGLAGVPHVVGFLEYFALPMAPLLALGVFRLRGRIVPALVAVTALLLFYLVPRHTMGFQWRFVAPVFPTLAVIAACGVPPLVDRIATATGRLRAVQAAVILLVCPALAFASFRTFPHQIRYANSYAAVLAEVQTPLGQELRSLRGDGPRPVLAIGDAGVVPYYSEWESIDTAGLNERLTDIEGPPDVSTVVARNPDLVVLNSLDRRSPMMTERQLALYHACEKDGMRRVRVVKGGPAFLWLLARPGSRFAEALEGWPANRGPNVRLARRALEDRIPRFAR